MQLHVFILLFLTFEAVKAPTPETKEEVDKPVDWKAMKIKQWNLLKEFINTEVTYLESLQLIPVYLQEITKCTVKNLKVPKELLKAEFQQRLLGNVREITELHESGLIKSLKLLQSGLNTIENHLVILNPILHAFSSAANKFNIYIKYFTNDRKSKEIALEWEYKSFFDTIRDDRLAKESKAWLDEQKKILEDEKKKKAGSPDKPSSDTQDQKSAQKEEEKANTFFPALSAILIQPVQRLPRYVMLFKEILKTINIDVPDEAEHAILCKKALSILIPVLENGNRALSQEILDYLKVAWKEYGKLKFCENVNMLELKYPESKEHSEKNPVVTNNYRLYFFTDKFLLVQEVQNIDSHGTNSIQLLQSKYHPVYNTSDFTFADASKLEGDTMRYEFVLQRKSSEKDEKSVRKLNIKPAWAEVKENWKAKVTEIQTCVQVA